MPDSLTPVASRKARWTVLAVAPCLIVVAVLLSGFAGVAPWSKAMAFGHSATPSSSSDLSFDQARTLAAGVVAQASGAPWSAVAAIGVAVSSPVTIPGPTANTNASPLGCGWTPSGSQSLASVTFPATSGSLGVGLSAAWMLLFSNSSGALTIVAVLNGQASALATLSAGPCSYGPPRMNALGAGVIDSTQAASIANSWGGSAFRANYSGEQSVYSISGGMTYSVLPPCSGSSTCNSTSVYGNGSQGTPPPPVPPAWGPPPPPANITIPSAWSVMFLNCASALSSGPCSGPLGSFFATIDALNGTVQSVSSSVSGWYGLPPPGVISVPPEMPGNPP